MPIGLTLPFAKTTGSLGYLDFTSTELDAVRQNIKSLLVTNWGERVGHFNLGCNLVEFLFENIRGAETKQRIADRIVSQIATWMSFVSVEKLNIFLPEDDDAVPQNGVGIHVAFRITSRPNLSSVLEMIVSR